MFFFDGHAKFTMQFVDLMVPALLVSCEQKSKILRHSFLKAIKCIEKEFYCTNWKQSETKLMIYNNACVIPNERKKNQQIIGNDLILFCESFFFLAIVFEKFEILFASRTCRRRSCHLGEAKGPENAIWNHEMCLCALYSVGCQCCTYWSRLS